MVANLEASTLACPMKSEALITTLVSFVRVRPMLIPQRVVKEARQWNYLGEEKEDEEIGEPSVLKAVQDELAAGEIEEEAAEQEDAIKIGAGESALEQSVQELDEAEEDLAVLRTRNGNEMVRFRRCSAANGEESVTMQRSKSESILFDWGRVLVSRRSKRKIGENWALGDAAEEAAEQGAEIEIFEGDNALEQLAQELDEAEQDPAVM